MTIDPTNIVRSGQVRCVNGENVQCHTLKIKFEDIKKVLKEAINTDLKVNIPDESHLILGMNGAVFVWVEDKHEEN